MNSTDHIIPNSENPTMMRENHAPSTILQHSIDIPDNTIQCCICLEAVTEPNSIFAYQCANHVTTHCTHRACALQNAVSHAANNQQLVRMEGRVLPPLDHSCPICRHHQRFPYQVFRGHQATVDSDQYTLGRDGTRYYLVRNDLVHRFRYDYTTIRRGPTTRLLRAAAAGARPAVDLAQDTPDNSDTSSWTTISDVDPAPPPPRMINDIVPQDPLMLALLRGLTDAVNADPEPIDDPVPELIPTAEPISEPPVQILNISPDPAPLPPSDLLAEPTTITSRPTSTRVIYFNPPRLSFWLSIWMVLRRCFSYIFITVIKVLCGCLPSDWISELPDQHHDINDHIPTVFRSVVLSYADGHIVYREARHVINIHSHQDLIVGLFSHFYRTEIDVELSDSLVQRRAGNEDVGPDLQRMMFAESFRSNPGIDIVLRSDTVSFAYQQIMLQRRHERMTSTQPTTTVSRTLW
jgi:hypothetical protein